MRKHLGIFLLGLFAATFAEAGGHEDYSAGYEEERELTLAAGGLQTLRIEAGAGSLRVAGAPGVDQITVSALLQVEERDPDEARALIEQGLRLSLERDGNRAVLVADFDRVGWRGRGGAVALRVEVPEGMVLDIDDSSGSIGIRGTKADVTIDDGSGSIEISDVATVDLVDGSGSIKVSDASGDVTIEDGSGSILVERVGGTVRIDDGSGSIRVSDVAKDLIIEDAGSGSVNIAGVQGTVETDS